LGEPYTEMMREKKNRGTNEHFLILIQMTFEILQIPQELEEILGDFHRELLLAS
jgi:hypothetical protein